ncbi:MAG: AAA family ATPase [Chloroflexi bacterium]|nr:AAA family ATPase [Chloroflexota bacterium]
MSDLLKILVVDQNADSLAALKKTLNFDDLEIVGGAGFGPVALTWARGLEPDLVLVVAEEPLARPLGTIQTLTQGDPSWTVVALATQFEREVFRKVVLAGARDVVLRSQPSDELHDALVNARRADVVRRAPTTQDSSAPAGTVVTVFGIKGGIGKSTIASNLAVALAHETQRSVALVDLELPFGDIALMLNVRAERDLLSALEAGELEDPERLQTHLTRGPEGVWVLPAPLSPQGITAVEGARVAQLLSQLASLYDYVVADTPPEISEITAAAMDTSALLLLITTPEVPCLRRTAGCLRLLQSWDYSTDKVKLVLNRAASKTRINEREAEEALGYPITWKVANDHAAMTGAAFGRPVVIDQGRSAVAMSIRNIARRIGGLPVEEARPAGWRARLKPILAGVHF